MVRTTIWHVTPESNIDQIQEDGLRPRPCTIKPMYMDNGEYERLDEGVYVCGRRRSMEVYASACLHDVRAEMNEGERFALFKSTVDRSRLHEDPEWQIATGSHPKAYICEGVIEDPELVTVGVLDEPAGNYDFEAPQ